MDKYYFYDTDIYDTNEMDYDISGEEYVTLIKTLCKYASEMSLTFYKGAEIPLEEKLEPYFIKVDESANDEDLFEIRYYKVCADLCSLIISEVSSIFSWIYSFGKEEGVNNPEDISFYREDGSLLFESITHEGICILTPRDNETFNDILSNKLWEKKK